MKFNKKPIVYLSVVLVSCLLLVGRLSYYFNNREDKDLDNKNNNTVSFTNNKPFTIEDLAKIKCWEVPKSDITHTKRQPDDKIYFHKLISEKITELSFGYRKDKSKDCCFIENGKYEDFERKIEKKEIIKVFKFWGLEETIYSVKISCCKSEYFLYETKYNKNDNSFKIGVIPKVLYNLKYFQFYDISNFIVGYQGYYKNDTSYIIYESLKVKSLRDVINVTSQCSDDKLKVLICSIFLGIADLHLNGNSFYILSLNDIGIDHDNVVKINYYGSLVRGCQSIYFIYNCIDFGAILYQLVEKVEYCEYKSENGVINFENKFISEDLKSLINSLLHYDYSRRLGYDNLNILKNANVINLIDEIASLPYFKDSGVHERLEACKERRKNRKMEDVK